MLHRAGLIPPHKDGLAKIGIHQNCLFPRLCKSFCQLHRHRAFPLIGRTACDGDGLNIRTAELYVGAERLICFPRPVVVLLSKAKGYLLHRGNHFQVFLFGRNFPYISAVLFHVLSSFSAVSQTPFSFCDALLYRTHPPARESAQAWTARDTFRYPQKI